MSEQTSALDVQVAGNHYKDQPIQPVEYIHANGIGYFEGNVIKYVTRHREKGGAQDIKKAIQYLHFILEHHYGEKEKTIYYSPTVDMAYTDCFNAVSEIMHSPIVRALLPDAHAGASIVCEDILEEINRRRAKMTGRK